MHPESVLVTGGTGSFGRAFVRQAMGIWQRVVVFSRDELKQHQMKAEFPSDRINWFIGDVRDRDRLYRAFEGVTTVVHAAALKQVPACEYNPFEAAKTNVLGAQNIIDAAIDCGVRNVLALSTDKAVNPINCYGATKLLAEKFFIQGNAYAGGKATRFSCVRYGNVLGSRGSLLTTLDEQRLNGTVKLTDPRMTRFWIRLEDAVKFVLACLEDMRGGEIFVPALRACAVMEMLQAAAPGCKVEIIGIRPGEKLHEVLVSEDEARHAVYQEEAGRYLIYPEFAPWGPEFHWPGTPLGDGFSFRSDTAVRMSAREAVA